MIRLIAVMIFSLAVTASAHALTPAPISVPEPDDMITQVAVGCGPGRTPRQWRMRGSNDHPPHPPCRTSLCAVAGKHLRAVRMKQRKMTSGSQTGRHSAILHIFRAHVDQPLRLI